MPEKKKMSVAEIMAAARKADSKGQGAGNEEAAPDATNPVQETAAEPVAAEGAAPVESAPQAAAPAAKPKPAAAGARPSVADILKAAREAKAGAAPAPAAKTETKPAEPKASPKPAAAKPSPKAPAAKADGAAKAASGVKDTASILAAARKDHKPGPMSKAEATTLAKAEPEAKTKPAKPVVPPMPAKPVAAKPKAKEKEAASDDRRMFLSSAMAFAVGSFFGMGCTALAATASLWTLGTARFMFPNVLIEPPSKFKVGFPSDFAPGMVEEKFKAQFGVWVVKSEYQGQLQIYALKTVCTHLGCTPNWLEGEQKFKCPCHGSGFYKDGINFEGPAPRPLERYAIHLSDDGQIEIDKSKIFQEEMGQWKDAASFVAV